MPELFLYFGVTFPVTWSLWFAASDTTAAVVRQDTRTPRGFPIGGAMVAYLPSPGMRRRFEADR